MSESAFVVCKSGFLVSESGVADVAGMVLCEVGFKHLDLGLRVEVQACGFQALRLRASEFALKRLGLRMSH